jgi:hypothetical protein
MKKSKPARHVHHHIQPSLAQVDAEEMANLEIVLQANNVILILKLL